MIAQRPDTSLLANYTRQPVTFVRGEGCELIDAGGARYLDCVAGIGVCALGHARPEITGAIAAQAAALVHCSNLYHHEPASTLAAELCTRSGFGRVFFCNSGAEANEAAIKLARKYAFRNKQDRVKIVSFTGSFHGRTYGALAATANKNYQEGFGAMPAGFEHVPFNDANALSEAVDRRTAAVIIEPVQGESGVYPADRAFLQAARDLCSQRGALLIFDEVQCGMGRLGPLFAFEWCEVRPDIVTMAKGLANGLPIGAVLIDERFASGLKPGDHGSTFGGSPVPCAAALAHLRVRDQIHLEEQVRSSGAYLASALQQLHERFPQILSQPRGAGLMQGVTVHQPFDAAEIVRAAFEHRVLLNAAGNNSLRFIPPLVITPEQIQAMADTLSAVLESQSEKLR